MQYPDDFVARLHAIWGEGFLSPGGPEEVRAIVAGLDLAGRRVLDIGSGTGGPAIVLARDLGADVLGIDVEPELVARSEATAERLGLDGRLRFRLVEPGPLPFEDASFEVVFSKDAMIHIPDKPALFAEVLRVLRPGGRFAASDWLAGEDVDGVPSWRRFRELGHLEFAMATRTETEAAMRAAGLSDVASRDRNAWFAAIAREELARIEGPLRDELTAMVGEETYGHWLAVRRSMTEAAEDGALRPTHLSGARP